MDSTADIYDADELREEIEGDLGLLRELVDSFDRDTAGRMVRLRSAIQTGDVDLVRREGHALKGGTGLFYARTASATAASIEEMGITGDLSNARVAVDRLEREIGILRAELDKLFKG